MEAASRQARSANTPLRTLAADEKVALEALGEILLPGSAAAGLAYYIDHQLSGNAADSMLMIKYLGVAPPFLSFYRDGLRALDGLARHKYGQPMPGLSTDQGTALVTELSAGHPQQWQGPPAGLFYFVLRCDAIDVTYGTQDGFASLGVPYMPHIVPPTRWGA